MGALISSQPDDTFLGIVWHDVDGDGVRGCTEPLFEDFIAKAVVCTSISDYSPFGLYENYTIFEIDGGEGGQFAKDLTTVSERIFFPDAPIGQLESIKLEFWLQEEFDLNSLLPNGVPPMTQEYCDETLSLCKYSTSCFDTELLYDTMDGVGKPASFGFAVVDNPDIKCDDGYRGSGDKSPPHSGAPYTGTPLYGGPYSGIPYDGARYPGGPYPGAPYTGAPYPGGPYPGDPYTGTGAPYSGGSYTGGYGDKGTAYNYYHGGYKTGYGSSGHGGKGYNNDKYSSSGYGKTGYSTGYNSYGPGGSGYKNEYGSSAHGGKGYSSGSYSPSGYGKPGYNTGYNSYGHGGGGYAVSPPHRNQPHYP